MKKATLLDSTFFIFLLASLTSEICWSNEPVLRNNCPKERRVELNETSIKIYYNGTHRAINCTWKIPEYVKTDNYAVVLMTQGLDLPQTKQGCSAELKFPGKDYSCNFSNNDCWVYLNGNNSCTTDIHSLIEFLKDYLKDRKCQFRQFEDIPSQRLQIDYRAGEENSNRQFQLSYHLQKLNCSQPSLFPVEMTGIKTEEKTTVRSSITNGTPHFTENTENTTTMDNIVTVTGHDENEMFLTIAVAVGTLILIAILVAIIVRKRSSKKLEIKQAQQEIDTTTNNRNVYINYIKTTDDAGYEIPMNARQYENLRTQGEYENFKDNGVYENLRTDAPVYSNDAAQMSIYTQIQ